MFRTVSASAALCILLALSGCSESSSSSTPASTETTTKVTDDAQPHAWLLTSAPDGAVSITEAKASAKEGDQVIIRGRIGGRHLPISADSPVFTLVDLNLEYCGQHSDDGCITPWDYCCETSETIATNSATVQIAGIEAVNPIAAGLEPLDELVVIGTVGSRPDQQVLTIRATGVFKIDG